MSLSLVVYPDANPESNSVDGFVFNFFNGAGWANLRDGSVGSKAVDSSGDVLKAGITSYSAAFTWQTILRSTMLFDTSSLPTGSVVSSAVLSLYFTTKVAHLSSWSLHICSSTPSSDTSLSASDYTHFGTTSFGSISYTSISTGTRENITLNSAGKAAISIGGITKLGARMLEDLSNSPPSWISSDYNSAEWSSAEVGTSEAPRLTITYIAPPTVTTQAVSSISYTTATGNGNITVTGGETNDYRGVVYSTSTQSTPGNVAPGSSGYSGYVDESGSFSTGAFTESLTGLSPNTTYYARAFTHNPTAGYKYGTEVSFTTLANTYPAETTQAVSSIAGTAATANGNITDTGNQTPDIRGFVYDTSSQSDPVHTAPASSAYASNISTAGSYSTGAFTGSLTALTPATTYYVRSFAHNASGYSYGSEVSFTTLAPPTVTTQAVTDNTATLTTATGNGNVTSAGGGAVTERGTVISTSSNPTTADTKFTAAGTTGAFTTSMTSLIPGTLYHVRAYAINSIGTSYGSDVTFTAVNFLNPDNAYTDDGNYCTAGADTGAINIQLSGDGGSTWSNTLSKTYTGTESTQTFGNGSTELWGLGWTGAMVTDSNFRLRVSCGSRTGTHIWKTFGFAPGASVVLTGIDVSVKAKWTSPTASINHIKVKIYYGTSTLPVQAGSQQYATNGGLAGTGALEVYDGSAWQALDAAIEIMKKLNPVGTIYINKTNSTNPATLFGFGTWTAITDRMIIGASGTYAAGSTGGAPTVTSNVTVATQPTFTVNSHTHPLSSAGQAQVMIVAGGLLDTNQSANAFTRNTRLTATSSTASSGSSASAANLQGATDATSGTATTRTADTALTNNAVGSLNPYVAAYVWERTA